MSELALTNSIYDRFRRLPGIRHIRCFFLSRKIDHHARAWASIGIGLGYPNDSDIEWLRRIYDGEA